VLRTTVGFCVLRTTVGFCVLRTTVALRAAKVVLDYVVRCL
jgi:hypothetical protein